MEPAGGAECAGMAVEDVVDRVAHDIGIGIASPFSRFGAEEGSAVVPFQKPGMV